MKGKSRLTCAFIESSRLPIPSTLAVAARVEGDPPARRDQLGAPGAGSCRRRGSRCGRTCASWYVEPGLVRIEALVDRGADVLGHPDVGEREDVVVVAARDDRVEAPVHLADRPVDAAIRRRGAVRARARRRVRGEADLRSGSSRCRRARILSRGRRREQREAASAGANPATSGCASSPSPGIKVTAATAAAGHLRLGRGREDAPPGRPRRRRRRGRGRGAARDPGRRPGARGDHADAGQRRGAGARLPARRGADRRRASRRVRPRTSPPTRSRSPGRCCAIPASAASTRRPRAGSAARARSRRSRSTLRARPPGPVDRALAPGLAARPAPPAGLRADRRPPRDRPLRRRAASCSASARTSAATTRWTR